MGAGIQITGGLTGPFPLLLEYRGDHGLAVVGHDLETVLHDAAQGLQINAFGVVIDHRFRGHLLHFRQSQHFEQTNPGPARIEFEAAHGQFGGVRIGVVIVVQLFTTNQDAPG